jgi:site-specific DNA-adenine methylase
MKAPFPYFGGKSTVAPVIWKALGQPKHYIEPFCGSAAVLLARPDYNPQKHMETICDKDGYVANAWRGMQFAPDEVARYCDWPVNHADLNARRKYLNEHQDLLTQLSDDPEYFDATIAGYWIWAMSCWIGSGMTRPKAVPDVTNAKGVHKGGLYDPNRYPGRIAEKGVHKKSVQGKRPHIGNDGIGIHQILETPDGRPQLSCPQGVHQTGQIPSLRDDRGINTQIPHLSSETGICRRPAYGASGAHGVHKVTLVNDISPAPLLDVRDPYTPGIYQWFRQLSERLRRVRVVCGDWSRVCGGDWQDNRGTCGMFFDPPYNPETTNRDPKIYMEESATVADDIRNWCQDRGSKKTYRIVLAGYYDEHAALLDEGWTVHRWSAHGGFANRGNGKTRGAENRHKEALFFSPHCHSSGLKRFCEVEA